jgi:hypothetical protein
MVVDEIRTKQRFTLGQTLGRMSEFQANNPGLGSDFNLDHVWGAAWKRTVWIEHLEKEGLPFPPDSGLIVRAWERLTNLELGES